MRGAATPRTTSGRDAAGQLAGLLDPGDRADPGVAPVDAGHEEQLAVGRLAASAAARASSVSRAMVTTMPGSTTPEVRGSRGRVWSSSAMRGSISFFEIDS